MSLAPQHPSEATRTRYTLPAIVLHWLIAFGIIVNVALGLGSESLPAGWIRPALDTHKSIGITVLGLAILRVLWRLSHRPPPLLLGEGNLARIEKGAAHVTHTLLYLLIFLLPLTGWMHDSAWLAASSHPMKLFGIVPWPRIAWITELPPVLKETWHGRFGTLHTYAGYALYVLLGLHIAGALKHEWLDRHSVIRRMLP